MGRLWFHIVLLGAKFGLLLCKIFNKQGSTNSSVIPFS